ncbi:MAG: guanylate kinase [Planctomycetes bacterium]|nr:guanylate kinase [Planctomycetota bacterium]
MTAGGRLIVLSGPSGVGKTTVAGGLMARGGFARAVTATTRAPRPGERDGEDYIFLDRPTFLRWIEEGKLLEHAEVFGDLYGTPRASVDVLVRQGRHVLLAIDVQGARQLRASGVPALFVFLLPPSWEELERRLRERSTEDEEAIARRLETARREMDAAPEYDARVVNDDVEAAVEEIASLTDA